MARTIQEIKTFSREQLEEIAKGTAKLEIIGGIYYGVLGEQTVEWKPDGSLTVTTSHTPDVR